MDKNTFKTRDKDFGVADYFTIATCSVGGMSHGRQKLQEELQNKENYGSDFLVLKSNFNRKRRS